MKRYPEPTPGRRANDKTANDLHVAKRREILDRLTSQGIQVPKLRTWKLAQLHMLQDIVQPHIQRAAFWEQQYNSATDDAEETQRQLDALRALDEAIAPEVKRWPPEGTHVTDQAQIATRLLKLAERTSRTMTDYLEVCKDVAYTYKLRTFKALATVESMAGYTWDPETQDYTPVRPWPICRGKEGEV